MMYSDGLSEAPEQGAGGVRSRPAHGGVQELLRSGRFAAGGHRPRDGVGRQLRSRAERRPDDRPDPPTPGGGNDRSRSEMKGGGQPPFFVPGQ